jgi:hypothetical protein
MAAEASTLNQIGGNKHGLSTVRVEDGSSIGRSYSKKQRTTKGLGAQRRQLRTKTFTHEKLSNPTKMSLTMKSVNLRTATRADILAYFTNTWYVLFYLSNTGMSSTG